MNFICKVFRFLLDIFKGVVNVIAEGLSTIAVAVVDVLSEVASSVGSAFASSPLGMAVIGVGLFFAYKMFFAGDDEAKGDPLNNSTAKQV